MPESRPVALVTGAAHRVGRALAIGLSRAGYDIALHYHSSASKVDESVAGIEGAGTKATLFQADLTLPDAPTQLVRDVVARCRRLDVVVNSAAVMIRMPLPDGGVLINIADLAAFETWPAYVPHGVSKSGVVYLTRALARVLAPRIRVNAIAPGTVLLPEDFDPKAAAHLTTTTPLKRDGSPDDVVQAMLYLLRATYVTGETIIVDGGRHVRT
jgi:pteridine reductase